MPARKINPGHSLFWLDDVVVGEGSWRWLERLWVDLDHLHSFYSMFHDSYYSLGVVVRAMRASPQRSQGQLQLLAPPSTHELRPKLTAAQEQRQFRCNVVDSIKYPKLRCKCENSNISLSPGASRVAKDLSCCPRRTFLVIISRRCAVMRAAPEMAKFSSRCSLREMRPRERSVLIGCLMMRA